LAKDPVCGMIVDEKQRNINRNTWVKCTISVVNIVKTYSTKKRRNMKKLLDMVAMVVLAAVSRIQKLFSSFKEVSRCLRIEKEQFH